MKNFEISVLDLAPVKKDKTIHDTFNDSLDLARFAEKLGYKRFWLAEHHNMASIASSATSVLIGYIANGTQKIRVGSGGIMLPNHSSLVIAEQFGTLESLFPHRIDLGVGRAPGTDGLTAKALGRNPNNINQHFPQQIQELQRYFSVENSQSLVRAIPGEGCDVPIYVLGSSTDSAWLAAELGLPYAFAGHFAPQMMESSFEIYHQNYRPSKEFPDPYTIACVNGIAAETDTEATKLSTTLYQAFVNLIRNDRKPYAPPVDDMDEIWNPMEKMHVQNMLKYSFIGGKETIKKEMEQFQKRFRVNEFMITSHIYEHEARLKSYEIIRNAVDDLNQN
ncbi:MULTISPECIES: LLM class flavin-dependent oxidoreductase [unclassified Kaistella]|uniref:LLM class flavin-dependent oxidoreductase n=1 Tax=unclassified Kaistella TaxID=2762626 RepID=UPI00273768DA|nr:MULTISPECIES: LLM class flavin-dependent oxidoreductase [unclassified Kaistella]MDP2452565.1 LLM class flavin-dependent oxidoreductase [Kaistella sp. SH11-4b]MDP2455473.1 LLM class flavin-dependent oxidoreductase [Kaistella sp. SH40-3]MDP2458377.1 LLM class flavin-dependent oxidoreductase [Kaistella sp. SH19-2b]